MAEGCPTLDLVDRFNSTPPAGAPAVRTPFIILFDGSAGSSWFAESLDRHPKVFIAGYVLQDLRVLLGYDTAAPAAGRATARSSAPEPARVFEAVKEISREFWSGFRSRGRNFLGRGLETI